MEALVILAVIAAIALVAAGADELGGNSTTN